MLLGLEIAGVIVGLIYLWLEYRASVWLWAASIVMPAIYIFIYAESGFYADMGINIYYLVASIYGWVAWLRRGDDGQPLKITHTPRKMILPLTAVCAIAMVVITYVLINYTVSTVPYGDSFTTALSIVALYMLARKQAEQWLVWLAVDAVSCALYIYKGIHLTAWVGYRRWIKMIEEDATLPTA